MSGLDSIPEYPMDESTPFVVKDNYQVPAIPDYIPSPRRIHHERARPRLPAKLSNNIVGHTIVEHGVDFRPRDQQARIDEGRQSKVDKCFNDIMASYQDSIRKYNNARKYLKERTKEELENPTKKTVLAQQIVDRGLPITKEKALEKARRTVIERGR